MFDSLADRIQKDESVSTGQRVIRIVAVFAVAVLLFGGLYLSMQMLEG